MSLMERIKVKSFTSLTQDATEELIRSIQLLRSTSIIEALTKKTGKMTKTQRKIRAKKGKKIPNTKAKATAALAKLSPEELLKTIAMFKN